MTESELVSLIERAELNGLQELKLSGRSIAELPPEIGRVTTLRELYLDSNELTTIPASIGLLTELRILDLSDNQILSLPREIGRLKHLTKLKIRGNALSTLPFEIGKLTRLQSLDIEGNRLNEIPPEVGRLKKVRQLTLSGNRLGSVPPELGGMTALENLDLSKNQIAHLPDQIGQLRRLLRLYLDSNRLTKLPSEIGGLTSLKELLLDENQLAYLPREIGELAQLEELQLQGNCLSELPREVCDLVNLRALYIQRNSLQQLPEDLGSLARLHELRVESNALRALPQSLGQLHGITRLDLQHNQLTCLPESISDMSKLTELRVSNNRLLSVPGSIGKIRGLSVLQLDGNNLTQLPVEFGKFHQLKMLALHNNKFSVLPIALRRMQELRELHFDGSAALPPDMSSLETFNEIHIYGNCRIALDSAFWDSVKVDTLVLHDIADFGVECQRLQHVNQLDLSNNDLGSLPAELGNLSELRSLRINGNRLSMLPPELGKLEALDNLSWADNPILTPPPEILSQGTSAILAYLRELLAASRKEWVSKLLVVGEGGVGKTSLLRAVRGEPFDQNESSTRGIDIRPLDLPHYSLDSVIMTLNCWDFGGQEIYHATHQFFLTNRSLFVLVWNARLGYEQGRLYYWMDMISARAPESPVLLVATHTDKRDTDIPVKELQQKYPQIVGSCEISNSSGQGIVHLVDRIRETAAALPLMGERWPTSWLNAAHAVREKEENHMTPEQLWRLMGRHGVREKRAAVLARWLHELGDILFFQDDPELNDTVVLKPEWVTKSIGKVLESERVTASAGIFSRDDMNETWKSVPRNMRHHLLMLMEKFDLSYRTQESDDVSLVVERLPHAPPHYESRWDDSLLDERSKELSISYVFSTTIPAGIPTWFIARSHRFSTGMHWRNGSLFVDLEGKHLALIRAFRHDRMVTLSVRGPCPVNFFSLLKEGFDLTLRRFPGLRFDRRVPCPGHHGSVCTNTFSYDDLQKAIGRIPPVLDVQCSAFLENVSVVGLLFGLHLNPNNELFSTIRRANMESVRRMDALMAKLGELQSSQQADQTVLQEIRKLLQREFTRTHRRDQSEIETLCPSVFALRPYSENPKSINRWVNIARTKMELQLYCEEPGCWHPTYQGGHYVIDEPAVWLQTIAPYVRRFVGVFKWISPLVAPGLPLIAGEYAESVKNDINLMTALVSRLPDIETTDPTVFPDTGRGLPRADRAEGAALRTLFKLLSFLDSKQHWGNLSKILTPEGDYLWLCEMHARKYRY